MRTWVKFGSGALLGFIITVAAANGQTDGSAILNARINDITTRSGTKHWTAAWVTTSGGTFIKTLRKQGPSIGSSSWNSHCSTWYAQKAGSTALDGYSSATAQDYSGTNSPVVLTWDCRDAGGNLMADGGYKFWIQYAEDTTAQGPVTTSGLSWTKGATAATNTYANQSTFFSNMSVAWRPVVPPTPPSPGITVARINGSGFVMSGTGPASRVYHVMSSTNIAVPGGGWAPVSTNSFAPDGSFSVTNGIPPDKPHAFYRLDVP